MIDIHSHLLPGIDDGAKTLDEAVALAYHAAAHGITHSIITPHIHPGRYDNDCDSIFEAFQLLQNEIKKQNIALKIAYSAEVRISVEMMELIVLDKIPFLGKIDQQNALLLEFPHSHILPGSDKLVNWLLKRNIKPIIVHPERNKEIQADFTKIAPFLKAGCLLQITANSVVGKFGSKSQQVAQTLLEKQWVDFIATDAHNLKHRPPDLNEVKAYLDSTIGPQKSQQLLYDNPWRVVKDNVEW